MKNRLKEVLNQLTEINSRYADWDEQLDLEQKELVNQGMDFFDAMEEVGSMRSKSIREGNSLVDFNKLNRLLDELCMVYLTGEKKEQDLIRRFFSTNKKILNYLHSYIGRNTLLLRSEKNKKWIRLGIAAVSICDRRVDWRDLLVVLGALYFTGKSVGISPTPFIKAVAKISSEEEDKDGQSTKNFIANFTKTAYYKSVRKKWMKKEDSKLRPL